MSREYVAVVLEKAADYIDQHGWSQAHYREPDGRVCLVGAINEVINDPDRMGAKGRSFEDECAYAVDRYLRLDDASTPEDWNDADGRTQGEVTQALRDAAEWERGR